MPPVNQISVTEEYGFELSANIPGYLNTDQPRHFNIDGNRLVVSETYLNGRTRIKAERIFARDAAPSSRNP